MVNYMREHMPQDARIHYVITNGGAAPNIVPEFAESYYVVRHPDPRVAGETVRARQEGRRRRGARHRNDDGLRADRRHLQHSAQRRAGTHHGRKPAPRRRAELERKRTCSSPRSCRKTCPARAFPRSPAPHEIRKYQFNGQKYSSTDSGDVSWVTPLATLNTATWVPGTAAHSWQATAAGGMTSAPRRRSSRRRPSRSPARNFRRAPI